MPTISIYIKEEDWDKWKAIEKKSEFVHEALQRTEEIKIVTHDELQAMKGKLRRGEDVWQGSDFKKGEK